MPSASSVVKELNCVTCGKLLVKNGKVECPRCKQQIELPASQIEGKWFCPECPAHGEKPHVLAINGRIKCRRCKEENNLIRREGKMRETDYPRNKIIGLLEKALKRTQAGELEWRYRLDADFSIYIKYYEAMLDSLKLTLVDHDELWISLPTGENTTWDLPFLSRERKLSKQIRKLVDEQLKKTGRGKEQVSKKKILDSIK